MMIELFLLSLPVMSHNLLQALQQGNHGSYSAVVNWPCAEPSQQREWFFCR